MKLLNKTFPIIFILLISFPCIFCLASELTQTLNCLNQYISSFQSKMRPSLYTIFKKTFPNTLSTTIQHFNLTKDNEYTYIITGDIQAMWLRDSTNQFLPYLKIPVECPHVKQLAKGLINAQAQFIMTDPYTNAFKKYQQNINQRPFYLNDKTQKLIMGIPVDLCRHRQFATKSIWQRKFQIDSLASFLRLTYEYYTKYHDISIITNVNFINALKRILTTLDEQVKDQYYEKQLKTHFYTFYRDAKQLANGTIKPSSRTGMIKTGFRPSDDANELAYNVPGNAMMASFLELVANQVIINVDKNSVFYNIFQVYKNKMINFARGIRSGIDNYGMIDQPVSSGGRVYAYQVDGFGNFRLYDDANLPSLLSLPYFGYVQINNIVYQNTRKLILSKKNPFYFENNRLRGVGSSHTSRDYVWPLAVMVEALTSTSEIQITNCLYNLEKSALHDLMHEAYSVHNPSAITREWFAWANSFFGELIVTLEKTYPKLLK